MAVGCAALPAGSGWHDAPSFGVRPVALGVELPPFQDAVARAGERWRVELAAVGCEASIDLRDDGHEIRGWTEATWPLPTNWLGSTSFGADESIDIVGDLNPAKLDEVLLHELGHALGLPHVEDRPSLMNPQGGELTDQDVEVAAVAIGCR